MQRSPLSLALSLCVLSSIALLTGPSRAHALDIDLGLVGLIGSGIDTGDAPNNPYRLQLGGAVELTLDGFVLGLRGTRSLGSSADCDTTACVEVHDLRTFGGDVGFDWEFALLHISPRFGIGRLKERGGSIVSTYLEPGGVAELEIAILTLGVEVRYRAALKDNDASGLLGYFRAGLRF